MGLKYQRSWQDDLLEEIKRPSHRAWASYSQYETRCAPVLRKDEGLHRQLPSVTSGGHRRHQGIEEKFRGASQDDVWHEQAS